MVIIQLHNGTSKNTTMCCWRLIIKQTEEWPHFGKKMERVERFWSTFPHFKRLGFVLSGRR